MSLMQQRNSSSHAGFGKTVSWSFIVLTLLYVAYSSHLLLTTNRECLDTGTKVEEASSVSNSTSLMRVENEENNEEESVAAVEDNVSLKRMIVESEKPMYNDTTLEHIVFGIAASSNLWEKRKEYVKTWYRRDKTRAIVWMDKMVRTRWGEGLPEIKVSGDTSKFKYSNRQGQRSALRISRVVSEMLRLGLKDVRWFVMGDDDTVFMVDNVVRILSKYDHNQFYYIGSSSESHLQNIFFSYSMAYGGGGFAISYPLAKELEKIQDRCIQRYPLLYGSDDRIQACMAELGVPLSKEPGFHQYDVYGDLLGLLAAHPVAPLASLHHLDVVEPIFPSMTQVKSLHHLFKAVELDSASIMQQSICYDSKRSWSISVSWGFVVQIWRGIMSPRELEMPARTFLNWYRKADYTAYAFNTRPATKHPCTKAFVFYMSSTKYDEARRQTISIYSHQKSRHPYCRWKMASPEKIDTIVVLKRPDPLRWQKSPRRDCCRMMPTNRASTMYIQVANCQSGEINGLQRQS